MNHKKKEKSNNEQQQFEFCEPQKFTVGPPLALPIEDFDIKFFLKTPMPILPEHAQKRLWCIFCNCDILELDSQFAWSVISSNAVEHLASEEHWKRVKRFMWKYEGGIDRVDLFRIVEADYAKDLFMETKRTNCTLVGVKETILHPSPPSIT
ncbi:hypothetical protein C2S52_013789 [Perilla frutescens var. hirtella]|nr:hypothetical protein C2S52_013789 [Perilla frutescens var. hirtella]